MAQTQVEMQNVSKSLEFTGNWFIDAGILGFINLMEEVYGWDLEELQRRIKEEAEVVYYWYFPIGYVCHVVRETQAKKGSEKIEEINKVIRKISNPPKTEDKRELFNKAWVWIQINEPLIDKTKSGKSRVKLSWSGKYRLLTNFPLFQPGYVLEKQRSIFMSLLGLKALDYELLIYYIDKTTSKFLPSLSEFPNISYTKSCLTMDALLSLSPRVPMFILTYPLAFISHPKLEYQVMVYSPDLGFTYNVNKKLSKYLGKSEQNSGDLLKVTWRSIIDSLTEIESLWSIENMYLIKIKPPHGQKQDLEDVEFIGISKLQAAILLDDTIREALNFRLNVKDTDKQIWILEQFIGNKALYPIILKHVEYCLSNNCRVNYRASVYALCIDAKIREYQGTNELFGENFLTNYRQILWDIKDSYRRTSSYVNKVIRQILDKDNCPQLISTIKKGNKISFVNYLLKRFLEKSNSNVDFIFQNIVNNDVSWQNYALSLLAGIMGGVSEDENE